MARILAITNQKGGVGKTTTSINLAASLVMAGRRVLLVDLDPQGSATTGSGVDKRTVSRSVYHMLIGDALPQAVRVKANASYDLLPANRELAGAELELIDVPQRETQLKAALASIEGEYDFVLLDCPPALNLLTLNGLCAAHAVMIPMQCEYYALEGLSDLVQTIKKVKVQLNPRLEIEGLLRTMYDPRNTLAQQVSEQLQQHFGDKLYRTIIPRNIRLAEAPSHGLPVIALDRQSKGALAYLALAGEMLSKPS
ncbi:MAG TPA: ParA family protein [Burkholderiales bacterium]|nr:ParA family protein [Burkholderiales bacterium]